MICLDSAKLVLLFMEIMSRLTVWVMLLAGLFTFQSVWNVAAAFCTHENQAVIQQPLTEHFGHHQLALEHQAQHAKVLTAIQDSPDVQDHSDHLPSFSPVVAVAQAQMLNPHHISTQVLRHYDWNNLYQSPDLFTANPPPVFAPLLVG